MKALAHRRALPSEALTPSPQRQRTARATKENVDPAAVAAEPSPFRSPLVTSKPLSTRNRSPLPPRPPAPSSAAHKTGNNPLKRKLSLETLPEDGVPASVVASDSGVQVIVRIRPPNSREDEEEEGGKQIVQMISPYSVSILDHTFSFDSIADVGSTQEDIFKLVGLPLVENCLAGFNSSIFAYGQTGSGKTYTMWGPPSALSGDDSSSVEWGLTPRVFELLFSRIDEEQAKHAEKQLNYQCRCSFLEIYNEQITDLLEPTQRNLQIREDVRTGVYVDYLTEEYVCTMKDVTQLLIKGLANRRMSATSINAESSRSHCVFTCVVESRSKSMADGLSSLRISRINLVDLAGSERQKLTGAVGERLKEAGNINRSLSQLGNLINILAEVSQSGKQRHIPYRDSKLTFLLQESLGGNAKLAMICAISPSQSCKNESISTLRFAQRAKAIKNKAVVNEITQDDVNVLREQIRQLKDELLRMKSKTSADDNGGYSTGWNARRSLNLLRMSLSRPTALPVVKEDSDEEMEIDDDDVERSCIHEASQSFPYEDKAPVQSDNLKEPNSGSSDAETVSGDLILMDGSDTGGCGKNADGMTAAGGESCEINVMEASPPCPKVDMGANGCQDNGLKVMVPADNKSIQGCSTLQMTEEMILVSPANNALRESNPAEEKIHKCTESTSQTSGDLSLADPSCTSSISPSSSVSYSSLSIVPCQTSPILQSPTLSISPRVESYTNKSLQTFSSLSASKKDTLENDKSSLTLLNLSFGDSLNHKALNASLVRVNRSSRAPTEHLAASLQRGLQIIDNGKQSSALSRSSFRFSIKPIDLKPLVPVQKVDVGLQTLPLEFEVHEDSSSFICAICKNKAPIMEHSYEENLQLIPVDVSQSSDKLKSQVPKAVEKVLAGAFRREMALEDHCAKQAAQIAQLNRLVEQYKHERECNAIIEQTREDKISRLEGLMDGILPTEDFMEEEFISLRNEHKLFKEKYENHPEVLRINIELRRVQYELDAYRNFFDLGERDVLLEEIQDLRSQLQSYVDSSSMSTKKLRPLLRLAQSIEPMSTHLSTILESTKESVDEKIEEERLRWTETESKWISICEELRIELEASRSLAEKQKMELDCERTCKEELKEALETAMLGHARILEQYAELEEKHINLLGRHRQIRDGIADVKKAATKAGVKGAESKFIDALATEISAIKVEREKERRYWRDENKGLKTQLRDTAEAVQAAGELLVRLKEAEETAATAQKRALMAEQETEKGYQEIDNLKKNYDKEIVLLKQYLAESRLPKEAVRQESTDADVAKYDGESLSDQKWREEFEPFYQGGDAEFCSGTEPPSWFSGYDRCNI